MLILAFETSAKAASAALLEDGKLLGESYQNTGLTHSQTLMVMAENLLRQCGKTVADVSAVAVAAGPGSFTGVRIGVAAAKGFAWGREVPCYGVSTLEAMALSLGEYQGYVCPVMDARRSQVYNALFYVNQDSLKRITEDRAIALAQLKQELAHLTGINRSMIGQLENRTFKPSIAQLEALAEALDFDITALFVDEAKTKPKNAPKKQYNIAVAGTGYVGLSIATLLSQHNHVTAVDIIPEKVELINQRKSPIQDEYIEKYLAEKELDLAATLDGENAYRNADFVVIAAPTNYDSKKNYFDTSAVEAVIELVLKANPQATMVIKSTIPVGYTASVRKKYGTDNILFSPEFLRESKSEAKRS